MEKKSMTQLSRFLALYRSALRLGVILLTELFIIVSLMQYAIPEHDYLKHEKRLGAAILLAALLYVVIVACVDRDELRKVGGLIRRMCCFEQIMLILVLLWYILGCAVRSRLDAEPLFKFNDNRLFMFTMTVFAFYPFMTLMGKERAKQIFEGMIHFTMAIYTVFCAWCVWKYYRVEFLTFPSGLRLQNYREGVSMMIGGNINITAAAAVVMLGLCMYMILTQKRAVKILYILAAIVHLMVMILTNSRTSYLAFLCMVVAAGFLFTWDSLQKSNYFVRFAAGLIVAALCAGAVYAARGSLIKMFSHVYPTYLEQQAQAAAEEAAAKQAAEEAAHEILKEELAPKEEAAEQAVEAETAAAEQAAAGETAAETAAAEEPAAEPAPAEEPATEPAPTPIQTPYGDETARKMDDLNGRVSVWMTAIKIIRSSKDHFLFGVSPVFVKTQLEKVSGFDRSIPHAHNGILQVGVGIGAPAMLMFLLFELAIIVRCLIIVFRGWGTPFRYSWVIPVILMGILVIELVESMLFAMQRVNLPVFYVLAGWTVSVTREISNKKKR